MQTRWNRFKCWLLTGHFYEGLNGLAFSPKHCMYCGKKQDDDYGRD